MDGFVHLHVHSHYSLLDGANRIKDLVETAKGHGMDCLALTDHGNLFGAVDFYTTAREVGVRPILGLEAHISPTSRHDLPISGQFSLLSGLTGGWGQRAVGVRAHLADVRAAQISRVALSVLRSLDHRSRLHPGADR